MAAAVSCVMDQAGVLRIGHQPDHADPLLGQFVRPRESGRRKRAYCLRVQPCNIRRSGTHHVSDARQISTQSGDGYGWRKAAGIPTSASEDGFNKTRPLVLYIL